ncbi:MAG: DUF3990 domain-containing protein [Oscillospiraceae bacterium]|nr:DUF3990 domain-containing protein [Oscillospiraceae bacterium]
MVLYHGSNHIIERPEYGRGNLHNDYGRAFYCTESYELAAEWAVDESRDGFVNEYELDTEELTILDLTAPEYSVLNWLTILLENRSFEINNDIAAAGRDYLMKNHRIEYRSHDIIVGWRADDSYFSFARAFLNNTISLEQLSEEAAELAQAALKLIRALDGENPTPMGEGVCRRSLTMEYTDVELVAMQLGLESDTRVKLQKYDRWVERLNHGE